MAANLTDTQIQPNGNMVWDGTKWIRQSSTAALGTVTADQGAAGVTAWPVDVSDDATRDNGKIDIASLDQYVPVSGRLPVDGSGVTQPVSGTVTANAGTNLNTSALALEAGGNLATIAGKDFATQVTLSSVLTELQAKADLAETQPVSLATVPSHAVTNAGTFVVQENGAVLTALQIIDNFISGSRGLVTEDNSAAIKTAVETIDNVVSGSEAQVDVVTFPPDLTATDSYDMTGGTVTKSFAISGYASASVSISGTWTGSWGFQVSTDGGTSFQNSYAFRHNTAVSTGTASANGLFTFLFTSGLSHVAIRTTGGGTGTSNIGWRATVNNTPIPVNAAAEGEAPPIFVGSVGGVNSSEDAITAIRVFNTPPSSDAAGTVVRVVPYTYSNINSNATTVVKDGAGILHAININTLGAAANMATIYDNNAGSGTVIGIINTTQSNNPHIFDIEFATGLTIVTATGTAANMTVSYK